jgi:proline racemase
MANIPFGGDVYVISDAKYAELKQKQAADEIAVLNKRLLAYEAAADKLKETINELRIEHDLLPEATEE